MKELPKDYFDDEISDGFFLPGMMKRAWCGQLLSYEVLRRVCEEVGIYCTAVFGTLLGAVRNAGFVPWDDDIDLEMKRSDFAVLEKLDKEKKLPGDYWISDYIKEEQENMVRRWMSSHSLVIPFDEWADNYGFPFVGMLDLFLLDYIPLEPSENARYKEIIEKTGRYKEIAKHEKKSLMDFSFRRELSKIEDELGVTIDTPDMKAKPLFIKILRAMDEFCARYTDDNCDNLGILTYYWRNPGRAVPKELYSHSIDMRFEHTVMSVPIGYDGILRRVYHNYMQPILASGDHNYPFYEKMNEDMKTVAGFELSSYNYSKDDEEEIRKEKAEFKPRMSVCGSIIDALGVLREAHEYMDRSYIDNSAIMMELSGQCQEIAIGLGNIIEKDVVDPAPVVEVLQQYCEYEYSVYQDMESGGANNYLTLSDSIRECEDKLEKASEEIIEKRKLLFLTVKSDHWKSLHALWKIAVKDDEWDVAVVKVPYCLRGKDRQLDRDDMIIDTKGYPAQIDFTEYSEYVLEEEKPDVIIFQSPYDEYCEGMMVHPYYFSKNLRKNCKRLVLIPPFITREPDECRELLSYTLGTYLLNPGVMRADVIYAQSERAADVYIDIIQKAYGIDVSEYIRGFGSPLADWKSKARTLIRFIGGDPGENVYTLEGVATNPEIYDEIIDLPEEWRLKLSGTGDGFKGIMLYMLGGSMLYEHGMAAIDKAEQVMDYMERKSDEVAVFWYDDPYACEILKNYRPEIWDAYMSLRDRKERTGAVIISEMSGYDEDEISRLSSICIGMYGDGCVLMNECRIKNKPVLFEDPEVQIGQVDTTIESIDIRELNVGRVTKEGTGDNCLTLDRFVEGVIENKKLIYAGKRESCEVDCSERIWHDIRRMA